VFHFNGCGGYSDHLRSRLFTAHCEETLRYYVEQKESEISET